MKRASPFKLPKEKVLLAANLVAPEVRFVVANYYAAQDMRKRVDMQKRHEGDKEQHPILDYTGDAFAQIEEQVKQLLERAAMATVPGKWLLAQYGIGPVISAGLIAHIDITKAPTVGHIWRYAGQDSTAKWFGAEYVRGFIRAKREDHPDEWKAFIHSCRELNRKPMNVLRQSEHIDRELFPEEIRPFLSQRATDKVVKAEFSADNMLAEALSDADLPGAYRDLFPDVKMDWNAVIKALSKRPWNAQLKQICWHAGECFKRTSGSDNSYYGKVYRARKEYEIKRNEMGGNSERAKNYVVSTGATDKTKASLKSGKLPDGQLDRQATRYAVKLMLSHLHTVMHWYHSGTVPPKPYSTEILGHAHEIIPPHLDVVPGLEDALNVHIRRQAAE